MVQAGVSTIQEYLHTYTYRGGRKADLTLVSVDDFHIAPFEDICADSYNILGPKYFYCPVHAFVTL